MITDLTPTERRIFNLLSDGQPHSLHEMRGCLNDPFMENSTIRVHIVNVRKKIREEGHAIVYERWDDHCYRLARFVSSRS